MRFRILQVALVLFIIGHERMAELYQALHDCSVLKSLNELRRVTGDHLEIGTYEIETLGPQFTEMSSQGRVCQIFMALASDFLLINLKQRHSQLNDHIKMVPRNYLCSLSNRWLRLKNLARIHLSCPQSPSYLLLTISNIYEGPEDGFCEF